MLRNLISHLLFTHAWNNWIQVLLKLRIYLHVRFRGIRVRLWFASAQHKYEPSLQLNGDWMRSPYDIRIRITNTNILIQTSHSILFSQFFVYPLLRFVLSYDVRAAITSSLFAYHFQVFGFHFRISFPPSNDKRSRSEARSFDDKRKQTNKKQIRNEKKKNLPSFNLSRVRVKL